MCVCVGGGGGGGGRGSQLGFTFSKPICVVCLNKQTIKINNL